MESPFSFLDELSPLLRECRACNETLNKMFLLDHIKQKLFKPKSRFRVGESVQLNDGGHLMVVTEIITGKKFDEPLINCKWYESDQKITRTNLFPESSLKPFNWYQPNP